MRCALTTELLLRRLLLAGGLEFVGGCDPALPREQVVPEGFYLLLALLLYDVVALVGIARQVEVLVGLVAVVVDVLLVTADARQARVLVVAFPVVPKDYEGRLIVQSQLPVLIEEVAQEEVLVTDGVQVAIELVVPGELPLAVGLGDDVVVVGRDGEVRRQERLFAVLLEPLFARLEHDVVLVTEVVRLVVALLAHVLGREEVLVAEVLEELRTSLEVLCRRLEKSGPVAVVLEQLRHAPGGDGAWLRLGPLGVEGRGHPAE